MTRCGQMIANPLASIKGMPREIQCGNVATHEMFWPGPGPWRPICEHHIKWARQVAETLGFVLQERRLPCEPEERPRAFGGDA